MNLDDQDLRREKMANMIGDQMSAPVRVSRRKFASLIAAGTVGAVTAGAGIEAASAGRAWCRFDPIVMIDGQLADVFIGSTLTMLLSATGPINLNISIPQESKGSVVLMDLGFGRGYNINFIKTSNLTKTNRETPVIIDVYAPAKDSSLPVSVTFAPRSLGSSLTDILFGMSAEGNANEWMTLVP
jgi:hypothetical protein